MKGLKTLNDEENKWKDLQTEMEYLEGKLPKVVIPAFGSSPYQMPKHPKIGLPDYQISLKRIK